MANTVQAKKRARQAEVRRARNTEQMTFMRTQIKKVRVAIDKKDKSAAQTAYRNASAAIDRLAGKGNIHKNTAARYKSNLNQRVRAMA
ncbi:MAG: 30S ribosomal protein S20 [Candidatus Muproteobacteria bacterium RBG_16_62_13]|uniref:Small ribosomal subunit protein bS20 n=1 Tax=Candidatus Muproteobacteria bacterium RBG_16_62_13 TaxID=1817756 RepID=A0A1F6T9C1_9PROT|nr:MAG: 30S ribosomal protein S20 [Candidatus Muproteobacteria bacterium RBG_16_62_13]